MKRYQLIAIRAASIAFAVLCICIETNMHLNSKRHPWGFVFAFPIFAAAIVAVWHLREEDL